MNDVYGPKNFSMLNTDHFAVSASDDIESTDQITSNDDIEPTGADIEEYKKLIAQAKFGTFKEQLQFQHRWLSALYGNGGRVTIKGDTIVIAPGDIAGIKFLGIPLVDIVPSH